MREQACLERYACCTNLRHCRARGAASEQVFEAFSSGIGAARP